MADRIIPLIPNTNQTLTCTLPIDGKNIALKFSFTYNTVGKYWFMSVGDAARGMLLDSVPLVVGQYPAADLLEQYRYLGIGSAVIVPTSSIATGIPEESNLGTDYVLVWGDTIVD